MRTLSVIVDTRPQRNEIDSPTETIVLEFAHVSRRTKGTCAQVPAPGSTLTVGRVPACEIVLEHTLMSKSPSAEEALRKESLRLGLSSTLEFDRRRHDEEFAFGLLQRNFQDRRRIGARSLLSLRRQPAGGPTAWSG